MRVKITHPITTTGGRFEAGTITEVTDALATEWIEKEWAIEFVEEAIEVTSMADENQKFIEAPRAKKGKVKYDR